MLICGMCVVVVVVLCVCVVCVVYAYACIEVNVVGGADSGVVAVLLGFGCAL